MTEQEEKRSVFPDARMLSEGFFTTPQGNLVNTTYVDLSGTLPLDGLTLVKATEPRFDLSTTESIRLSRPGVFRNTGEVLVKDEQEGQARHETRETVEGGKGKSTQVDRRVKALNAAMRLGDTRMSVNTTATAESTKGAAEWMTFGTDWLIYCTSIEPVAGEEQAWRRTFPESYTSVSRIYRPTQFAQALGVGICEHIGATGKACPLRGTLHGFRTLEMHRTPQLVVHGPVLYVDDPYHCIVEAEAGWARLCSMIFVKSLVYAAQREYRFAMLSIRPEVGQVCDLPVSGMLRDCLEPAKSPGEAANGAVKLSNDESEGSEESKTFQGYTYRRRKVTRESSSSGGDEPGEKQTKEEIVEETVTSPEEVPDPFPSDEQPDVIIVHQVGGQFRLVHNAYRDEETHHWRIETTREDPVIKDSSSHSFADVLEVPPDVRLESRPGVPVHPGFFLELCLDPSVPRAPSKYEGLERYTWVEFEHALACGQALDRAVEMVPDTLREMAAASAWYASLFIRDVVSLFGPVVRTVCVIRECVVVVELERAPLSGAVAWATFSGAGTFTLYIHHGDVEELTFAGQTRRAGPIMESTFVKKLEEHGWGSKRGRPLRPRR